MRATLRRIRLLAVGVAAAAAVLLAFSLTAAPASAHETPDAAPDTPFASAAGQENGLPHYLDALEHSQAANSLLRNPTCGAHNGPDGIHPPGNP